MVPAGNRWEGKQTNLDNFEMGERGSLNIFFGWLSEKKKNLNRGFLGCFSQNFQIIKILL